jgi:hypothetical protein
MSKSSPPLVIETVEDQSNYFYMTMIEYKRTQFLTIINDVTDEEIYAYSLDHAKAENIDLRWFLGVANRWYYANSEEHPLSFEFSKMGKQKAASPILKTFNIDYVSRLVGRIFIYNIGSKPKVKRRRVQLIPETVEIRLKKLGATI